MDLVALPLIITVVVILIVVVITAGSIAVMFWLRKATQGLSPIVVAPVVPMAAPQGGAKQIKKVRCRNCGASKVQPPKTAFLYCDFCGALVDWDFKVSITTAGSSQPGPEYQRLQAQVAPIQAQAMATGDRETYKNTLLQMFDLHMRSCPASYSPRIGDPSYRSRLLEFTAVTQTEAAFDADAATRKAAMETTVRGLQWYGGLGSPRRVESESFKRVVATFLGYQRRCIELSTPHLSLHPDEPSLEILNSIGTSAFAQGWLSYLEQPEQEWLIAELGLSGEYVPIEPVETTERHCGSCGAPSPVAAGAQRVVCEFCGHLMDVAQPELRCTGCSAPLSMPIGAARFACPHCSADLRIDGA